MIDRMARCLSATLLLVPVSMLALAGGCSSEETGLIERARSARTPVERWRMLRDRSLCTWKSGAWSFTRTASAECRQIIEMEQHALREAALAGDRAALDDLFVTRATDCSLDFIRTELRAEPHELCEAKQREKDLEELERERQSIQRKRVECELTCSPHAWTFDIRAERCTCSSRVVQHADESHVADAPPFDRK